MSDAKARHFKPHSRFPFVTSIWWCLNNSTRERRKAYTAATIVATATIAPLPATTRLPLLAIAIVVACNSAGDTPSVAPSSYFPEVPVHWPPCSKPPPCPPPPPTRSLSFASRARSDSPTRRHPPLPPALARKTRYTLAYLTTLAARPLGHATSTMPPLCPAVTDKRLTVR